jgi:plasmid stabilization system protein ParE
MKRYTVAVSSAAAEDVAGAITYIAETDGLSRAALVDRRLDRALGSLARLAPRGRIAPELRRRGIRTYHEIQCSPFRIIYRVVRREVWVLAVVEGRRDLDELLHERARREGLDAPPR